MSHYTHHLYDSFDDFWNEIPNNPDRKEMKESLAPIIKKLQEYGFEKPLIFFEITKLYNLKIRVFLEEINNGYFSPRIIDKANKFEINTIITFYATFHTKQLVSKLEAYISKKFPNFPNSEIKIFILFINKFFIY